MKPEDIKRILPNASKSLIELNSRASSSIVESSVIHGALAEKKTQDRNTGKRVVRITSYRTRLLDPDNLVGKWHLDSLRYARILYDDRPEDIDYQISQKKVNKKNQEKTLIQIYEN